MSTREPFPRLDDPDCQFCRIGAGTLDAAVIVAEGDVVAFLDHRPLFEGHVLVAPRAHHATLPDLPRDLLVPYFSLVQRLSNAVVQAMGAHGSFVAINNVVSQSVPHLHTHVVPRRRKDGLRGFFWPRRRYPDASRMQAVAAGIRAHLERPAELT